MGNRSTSFLGFSVNYVVVIGLVLLGLFVICLFPTLVIAWSLILGGAFCYLYFFYWLFVGRHQP